MSTLDRRLERLEATADTAWLERAADVLTRRVGYVVTPEECRTMRDTARRAAEPYLAAGMNPVAAYAAVYEMTEAAVLAEAPATADEMAS